MVDHQLDANARYSVKFFQGGKLIGTTDVDTHGLKPGQPLTQNISLAPLLPGAKIDLPNIYYNFNDATLRPDARKDLDLLIALMKQQPDIVVELASHTDCRGNAKYNQELSQKRAEGVLEYMAAKGIGRNRMKAVGFGESEPRNKCVDGVPCTDQEHGKNRRTEVRIPTNSQGGTPVFVNDQATDPTQVSTIPSGKVTVTTARADNYYVISGSFLMETRAYNHMKNLRSVGFGEANVVQFPNSTFFSVAVGKFGTRKEAIALEKKLAAENFESFIRAVQQQ
jgi:outer membrane protein OmpA-like peptidoglycan-associated protein